MDNKNLLQSSANSLTLLIENTKALSEEIEMRKAQIKIEYGDKIKQLKDGRWHVRYKNRQIFRTSYEAIIDEIAKRSLNEDALTIDSIIEGFFEERFLTVSGSTYGKDMMIYNKFIKGTSIATKNLKQIKKSDGVSWMAHCLNVKPMMKQKYWHNVRGTMNRILAFAIENDYIEKNPIATLNIHADHLGTRIHRPDSELIFSDEELDKVCKIAYAESKEKHIAIPLFVVLLYNTGIRDGELCSLRWRDINNDTLHIQSEMVEVRNKSGHFQGYKYVSHTKTYAGDRYIPLNTNAKAILMQIKRLNLECEYPISQDDYVFLRKRNNQIIPCTTRTFETRIKRYCREAGMTVLKSQHDLRRTFATNLFYSGVQPKDIQGYMGHESLEQTMAYVKQKSASDKDGNPLEKLNNNLSKKVQLLKAQ